MVKEMMLKSSLYNKIISIYTKQIVKSEILKIMQQSIWQHFVDKPRKYKCKARSIFGEGILFLLVLKKIWHIQSIGFLLSEQSQKPFISNRD
jgi:hypothetical protein